MSAVSTARASNQGKRTARPGKYLTFALGAEEYGLEILKVREIIGYVPVTAVPRTPEHVLEVINLRGQVIPVVDLRVRFGLERAERTEKTCFIVAEVADGSRSVCTGLMVDCVCEVREISGDQIDPAPDFGSEVEDDFIMGMAKVGSEVKILLDIDKVLTATEVAGVVHKAQEIEEEQGDGAGL